MAVAALGAPNTALAATTADAELLRQSAQRLMIGEACDTIRMEGAERPSTCDASHDDLRAQTAGNVADAAAGVLKARCATANPGPEQVCSMDAAGLSAWLDAMLVPSTSSRASCGIYALCEPSETIEQTSEQARTILAMVVSAVCSDGTTRSSAAVSEPSICGMSVAEIVDAAEALIARACSESCVPDTGQLVESLRQWVADLCSNSLMPGCALDPAAIVAEVERRIEGLQPDTGLVAFILATADQLSRNEVAVSESNGLDLEVIDLDSNMTMSRAAATPTVTERVVIGVATGQVISTLAFNSTLTTDLEPGAADNEASAARSQSGCSSYGGQDSNFHTFAPVHLNEPKSHKRVAGGSDIFLYRQKNVDGFITPDGRRMKVKKFLQCSVFGYKRKNNFVLTGAGGYVGPYVEKTRRLAGEYDASVGDSRATGTIGFTAGGPLGVNASVPVNPAGRNDGARWIVVEDLTHPRHERYPDNIVSGFWTGRSDRFQGNIAMGLWYFKQSSSYPQTPESMEDDEYETPEGFFYSTVYSTRCGSWFGVGC